MEIDSARRHDSESDKAVRNAAGGVHNKLGYRIMEQASEQNQTFSPQAGPGAGEPVLSDVNLSVAQDIGRQLGEMGDELNWHHRDNVANPLFAPVRPATHAHQPTRNRLYRLNALCDPPHIHWALTEKGTVGLRGMVKHKPGEVRACLTFLFYSPVVRRVQLWRIRVFRSCPSNPSSWAVWLLATAMLATAAIPIGF
ncbi:hypothetical protein AAFF_G00168030 [Aldrovandia affinis]|uniref:Uncharacterized protein n=1 Tax=Aldrovandia affinis TaxID=143900 RepID=A0AAD7RM68_9TELE|nr:hypothetical protein AAFF_G00168030 [Aldrovandia affinis]